MLFSTSKPDNSLLLMRLAYWPDRVVGEQTRKHICNSSWVYMTKAKFLICLTADQSKLVVRGTEYKINWAWNTVPSEHEWNRKQDSDTLKIELRLCPLNGGPVAIIEWQRRMQS